MASREVVVVGAGPTGLALACGLRAAGVAVRVLDGAPGPSATSRALGLQPRGVEVLDRLGALGDLPERSVPIGQVITYVDRRRVARLSMDIRTPLVTRPGLLVSQAEIEAELRRRLTELGGTIEWNRPVLGVEAEDDGVRTCLADEVIASGWVVGCDGAHSRVRKSVGITFPGVAVVEKFLLADVRADLALPRDAVSVWLSGDRMVGAFPLPGEGLWRLMAPAAEGDPDEDVVHLMGRAVEEGAGLSAASIRRTEWTSTFRIHRRLADGYRRGRVLLAGDAAHIHSPFGGQGMNTGLGDAENLAWKLALVAGGRAGDDLLDTYEAERRPIAEDVLASTSAMTRVVVGRSPLARLFRDAVFVPLLRNRRVQRAIREQSSQLKITYRRGPLGSAGPGSRITARGAVPGDRVPDIACRDENGRDTRLHRELGPSWALLCHPSVHAECAGVARAHLDGSVAVLTALSDVPATLLIRPDAHLAWRGEDPRGLDRVLGHILAAGRVR